jgi:P pilus assembly chaperone PapD
MKQRLHLLWAVALVATARAASAGVFAEAVPIKYNLTVRAGEPVARDVAVHNMGDAPVVVRVRLSDWRMDPTGDLDFLPLGSSAASLAGLVTFAPDQFALQPGETGVIHLTLRLPADGPATRYGVLLSEVRPTAWPANHLGPRAIAELGTTLYLSRIPPQTTHAELTGLDVHSSGDTAMAVTVRVHNPGERHFYSSGEIAIADSTGAVVAKGSLGTGVVLPGALRIFTWTCSTPLGAGRYTVTATLDTGEPELLVGETEVRWPIPRPAVLPVAATDER